jgi:diguanylate cyclase (GGDEF)-like protein
MHHFLAAPRAMAAVATKERWQRDADALPGAKRLLILTSVAAFMLAATVLGAVIFAARQIDETAIAAEMSRMRIALSTIDPDYSEGRIGSVLSDNFAFADAHFGDASELAEGEVALAVAGHDDRALIWLPNRIGTQLFAQLAPLRLGASALFLIGIVLLMRRLYLLARELEGRRAEAQALAARDPLTGLGNRLAFETGMARMLAQGTGNVALLYLDLDGFKQVNDTLGHGAGDDVLRTVGRRLAGLTQPTDLLVRLGGDEFVLLRPTPGSHDELGRFALTIEQALAEPVALGAQELQIGVSIGIAVAPADGTSGEALLKAADAALYRAKRDRSGFAMAAAA